MILINLVEYALLAYCVGFTLVSHWYILGDIWRARHGK